MVKSLHEATGIIQKLLTDPKTDFPSQDRDFIQVVGLASQGVPGYDQRAVKFIRALMDKYGLQVADMGREEAGRAIYAYMWGLDVIEELYRSPDVDEVRVEGGDSVYYIKKGRNLKADCRYKDRQHLDKMLARLLEHDRISLDESSPGVESVRPDGTRLTAMTYPLTPEPVFVLRKHGTFDISEENYIQSGSMSPYILQLLSVLVKGRANILICGDSNTGKTTLLRFLSRYFNDQLHIVTLETDSELLLKKWYPDKKDVTPIEAHPETGWDMRRCFTFILRLSADVIIVGEARGLGEAVQMINTLRSGHAGFMGTIHVYSVYEGVSRLAEMAVEEGSRLSQEALEDRVAKGLQAIVQLYGNSITGKKMVEQIVEVWSENGKPRFRDLCVWEPTRDDFECGTWRYPNGISDRLRARLFRNLVSHPEMDELERMRKDAE